MGVLGMEGWGSRDGGVWGPGCGGDGGGGLGIVGWLGVCPGGGRGVARFHSIDRLPKLWLLRK